MYEKKLNVKEMVVYSSSTCYKNLYIEYSRAVIPQVRQAGNRLSGLTKTAYASLLA